MVKAEDLRVGQVWRDEMDGRLTTIVEIEDDGLWYTIEPPYNGYRGRVHLSIRTFVGWANDYGTLVEEAPAPIPNPAALGDLYAACHEALSLLEANHQAWLIREDGPTFARLRAALAKAENRNTNEEDRK